MTWPTSIRTWLAGEKLTAVLQNEQLRDPLKELSDAWTSYVPVLGSDGTPPTTSTAQGGSIIAGKLVIFWARLVVATAGTGTYTVTFPTTAARVYTPGICGHFLDLSAVAVYSLSSVNNTTATTRLTHRTATFLSATSPVTVAAGDEVVIGGTYEAA